MPTIKEVLESNPNAIIDGQALVTAMNKCGNVSNGNAPTMKLLNTSQLISGSKYQRQINYKFIKNTVKVYNKNKVRPIIVSYRNGKYYVVDGQHTVLIEKEHNNGQDCMVMCQVLTGLTEQEEAKLFSEQFSDKHPLSSCEMWRSNEIAGDERTLNILSSVKKSGLEMEFDTRKTSYKNRLVCYDAVAKAYDKLGNRQFVRTLSLLKNTYNGDKNSLIKKMVEGMSEFMQIYSKDIDDKVFIRKLNKVAPEKIVAEAMTDKLSPTNGIKVAKVIYRYYNFRQTKNKLPNKFGF